MGVSVENVRWSVAGWDIDDTNLFSKTLSVTSTKGVISLAGNNGGDEDVRIVECRATVDGKICYAFCQIPFVEYEDGVTDFKVEFDTAHTLRDVTYSSSGRRPTYSKGMGVWLKPLGFDWTCEYSVHNHADTDDITLEDTAGSGYASETSKGYIDGIPDTYIQPQATIRPNDSFSGMWMDNNVILELKRADNENGSPYAEVTFPVCMMLNRYELESLNGWDGSSVQVDDAGYILAPQIGAGRKEDDNSFTGILMGERHVAAVAYTEYDDGSKVIEPGNYSRFEAIENDGEVVAQPSSDVGLYGYYKGQQSIFLNAEDGSAHFGLPQSNDPTINGMIELYPYYKDDTKKDRRTHIGNWYLGRNSFYSANDWDGNPVYEWKDLVPYFDSKDADGNEIDGNPTYSTGTKGRTDAFSKYKVNGAEMSVSQGDKGVIINSNPAYFSIKSEPFGVIKNEVNKRYKKGDIVNPNDKDVDSTMMQGAQTIPLAWKSANTILKPGDSVEVELDPNKASVFTIYRHTLDVQQKADGDDEYSSVPVAEDYAVRSRFFPTALSSRNSDDYEIEDEESQKTYKAEWHRYPLVGINTNGQFYSNAVEDGEASISVGPIGAFDYTAASSSSEGEGYAGMRISLGEMPNTGEPASILKVYIDKDRIKYPNMEDDPSRTDPIDKTRIMFSGGTVVDPRMGLDNEYVRPMNFYANNFIHYINDEYNSSSNKGYYQSEQVTLDGDTYKTIPREKETTYNYYSMDQENGFKIHYIGGRGSNYANLQPFDDEFCRIETNEKKASSLSVGKDISAYTGIGYLNIVSEKTGEVPKDTPLDATNVIRTKNPLCIMVHDTSKPLTIGTGNIANNRFEYSAKTEYSGESITTTGGSKTDTLTSSYNMNVGDGIKIQAVDSTTTHTLKMNVYKNGEETAEYPPRIVLGNTSNTTNGMFSYGNVVVTSANGTARITGRGGVSIGAGSSTTENVSLKDGTVDGSPSRINLSSDGSFTIASLKGAISSETSTGEFGSGIIIPGGLRFTYGDANGTKTRIAFTNRLVNGKQECRLDFYHPQNQKNTIRLDASANTSDPSRTPIGSLNIDQVLLRNGNGWDTMNHNWYAGLASQAFVNKQIDKQILDVKKWANNQFITNIPNPDMTNVLMTNSTVYYEDLSGNGHVDTYAKAILLLSKWLKVVYDARS